jgi:uncharacterized BrkB/YihY/UPF0761 family membrane protein
LAFVGLTLFLASFAGSMIPSLRPWLPDQFIPIESGIGLALAILLDVASFMVLYMLLPYGAATWSEILPGAIEAGFLWELAKKAFLSSVSTYFSMSNMVYGSVAAIIAFLAWALSEQPHLSLWRLLERLLLSAQTAATRSGRPQYKSSIEIMD